MRVGVDGAVYQLATHGGVVRIYDALVPCLSASDPELQLEIFLDGPHHSTLPCAPRVTARYCLPFPRYLRPYRLLGRYSAHAHAFAYWAASRRERLDLWHATYFNYPVRMRGKLVVANYDMIYWLYPHVFTGPDAQALRRQQRRALLAADHVIAISEATRADTIRLIGVDPDRISAIPIAHSESYRILEGSDPLWAPAVSRLLTEKREYLLYVGMRGGYKDFRTLVAALERCRDLDHLLVAVGPPLDAEELALLSRSGLSERVRVMGGVDDESLAGLYNHAAAFVHTSLYEGFGIPLLEAMACGCPIAASRIPSTLEVAADCATYFEPGDPSSAASVIKQVVTAGRAAACISDGLTRAARFTWKRCARDTLGIYRELVG